MRPTGRGAQVLFVGVASLAVALSLGTTQFYQLGYALLGLCAAAFALGLAGSRSLGLERSLSRREGITAGGSTTVGLRVTNGSRLTASGVQVVDRLPHRAVSRLPRIPAGEERLSQSTISFPRRGLYELGPAEVSSTDPFGLLRFRRESGEQTALLVYPEVHEIEGLPARGAEEAGGRAHPAIRGDELSGLRDYRPGDDRRFIHWKSVARTGELVVKEFDPDTPRRYSVVLDLHTPHTASGGREVEDAVSAAASAVAHLDRSGLSFRLRLTDRAAASTSFETGTGDGLYHAAMRLLAPAEADGGTGTGEALREEAAAGTLGEGVILVQRGVPGEAGREGLVEALSEVSSRGLTVFVVLVAAHTYETYAPQDADAGARREARLAELAREAELCGATVRVLRRETGVAGLAPVAGSRKAV